MVQPMNWEAALYPETMSEDGIPKGSKYPCGRYIGPEARI